MPEFLRNVSLKALAALPSAALFLLVLQAGARADVQVSGGTAAIRLVASEASLGEVLEALSSRYGVQSRLPPNLDRPVNGTFGGSLGQLLSRLLQGYSFVVETSASGTKVVVYDLNGSHDGGSANAQNTLPNMGANIPQPPPAWSPPHPPPGFPPLPGAEPAHAGPAHRRHMNR